MVEAIQGYHTQLSEDSCAKYTRAITCIARFEARKEIKRKMLTVLGGLAEFRTSLNPLAETKAGKELKLAECGLAGSLSSPNISRRRCGNGSHRARR
jgi:hypothetical protein